MRNPPPSLAAPVDATRVRALPRHFAWLDHRLRDRLHELSRRPSCCVDVAFHEHPVRRLPARPPFQPALVP